MESPIIARKLELKPSSEEIAKAGDYCVIENLGYSDVTQKPHKAIVLKCPFCRLDMASTRAHLVEETKKTWWRKLFNIPSVVTVSPMLQCPYNHSHKFEVKRSKVYPK